MGVTVVVSAPLLQARLLGRLPETLRARFDPRLSDAGRAVQFARSAPGVTAALVGMSSSAHVEENLALTQMPPLDAAGWRSLFGG